MRTVLLGLAALLTAASAHAVPLAFTRASFAWGDADTERLFTSLDLVDLGDPDPELGRFRIDLAGELHNTVEPARLLGTEFIGIEGRASGLLDVTLLDAAGVLPQSWYTDGSALELGLGFESVGSSSRPNLDLSETVAWTASFEVRVDAAAWSGPLGLLHYDSFKLCEYTPDPVEGWWDCDGGGDYREPAVASATPAAAMPEPGSAWLMALGWAAIALGRRRRRAPGGIRPES